MLTRALAAIVLIALVLLLLFQAPPLAFILAVLAVAELALVEYMRLIPGLQNSGRGILLMLLAAAIVLSRLAAPRWQAPQGTLLFVIFGVMALVIHTVLTVSDNSRVAHVVGASSFGLLYIPFSLSLLIPIRFNCDRITLVDDCAGSLGGEPVLFLLLVTWAADTGAYAGGRLFGRHRLAPSISPGKTVEGALAGLACSIGVGFAFSALAPGHFYGPFAAGVFTVVGQFGDLFESMLKRGAGVKDSSGWIPGHGGLLDRIDSLLICCPLLFVSQLARGS